MKLNRKQKDIILELINIEIENIQFELDKYSQHKYWSDKIKEYKEIREIINKDKDECTF